MHCPHCDTVTNPVSDIGGDGRVTFICGTCALPIGKQEKEPVVQAVVPRGKAQKPVAQSESFNVLRAAKKRLKVVEAEIKRLRKLEKEQGELQRIIAAASRPVATVRQIKAG